MIVSDFQCTNEWEIEDEKVDFFFILICVRCLLFKNRNENLEKIEKFSHGLKIAEQIVHIARSIPFSTSSFVCNV